VQRTDCQCIDCRTQRRLKAFHRRKIDGPSQYPPKIRRMFQATNLPGLFVLRKQYTNEDFERAIIRAQKKIKKECTHAE